MAKAHPTERNEFGLTPKEEIFAQTYVATKKLKEAAIAAGNAPKTASQTGYVILERPHVKARVDSLLKAQARDAKFTADEILLELKRLALLDPVELYNVDGTLRNIHEMPEHARRAIKEITVEEVYEGRGDERRFIGYSRKVKVFDKLSAIEKAMKHLGLLTEKLEVHGSLTLDALVTRSYEREQANGD